LTEPKHCEVCSEVHGPDNPIRPSEYERHGLLQVDPGTMEWGDGMPPSKEELDRLALGRGA